VEVSRPVPNARRPRIPHWYDLTASAGVTVTSPDGTTSSIVGNPRAYSAVGYSLTDRPQTVAELALRAGVGPDAAREALAQLEAGGLAEQTDNGREPDTWRVAIWPDA
jgi:hypothetical protein